MPYLVDGSNLGGAATARDRAAVLRLLLPWTRGRRRVVVVFDGPADPALASTYGALRLRFAGGRSADDVILGALGSTPGDWTVVSDDAALRGACRSRGARTLTARELLARLAATPPAAAERGEPPVDVADWEAWFRRGGG